MHAQTYRENTLLKTTRDQLSHLLCCVCQAPGSVLTKAERNTVNAAVINSLAWDSIILYFSVSGTLEAKLIVL